MYELTDEDIEAARRRGEARLQTVPRARAARFELDAGRITIDLTNACTFSVPVAVIPALEGADVDRLSSLEIIASGEGLHWPDLDVDLSVPNLLAGMFGTRSHQARRAGATRSKAKAEAARKNGLKGGRPRRASV